MQMGKRRAAKKSKPSVSAVRRMSTKELCMSLAGVAAFHVEDPAAQMKIYEAIGRLERIEAAAIKAGLLTANKG